MNKFRVFSTFTGIGGFEVGIRNAAERTNADVEFVGFSEIDKYAVSVFQRHFKEATNYGDITKINADELPDFDILVGGFPCQAFSIAGHRKGFDDIRGTLFFDLARILRAKRPRYFVFENVEGLTNHDHGRTFKTILATIVELGYDCQWQLINSKNHGVPQNRKRIIIVGHLGGTPRPKVFPLGIDNAETANPASGKGQIVDLTLRQPNGYRVRADERAGTLDANYYKGIANQERPGVLIGTLQPDIDGAYLRRLTPIECERLQAFNDNWTQMGLKWITNEHGILTQRPYLVSDTQRYKMLGNAVTTNVIQAVFERILS